MPWAWGKRVASAGRTLHRQKKLVMNEMLSTRSHRTCPTPTPTDVSPRYIRWRMRTAAVSALDSTLNSFHTRVSDRSTSTRVVGVCRICKAKCRGTHKIRYVTQHSHCQGAIYTDFSILHLHSAYLLLTPISNFQAIFAIFVVAHLTPAFAAEPQRNCRTDLFSFVRCVKHSLNMFFPEISPALCNRAIGVVLQITTEAAAPDPSDTPPSTILRDISHF